MVKAWVFPYGNGPVIPSGDTIRVTLRTGEPEQGRQVPLPRIEWTKGQSALFNEGRGTMGKKALTVEQLEQLPDGTVVRDAEGRLWVREAETIGWWPVWPVSNRTPIRDHSYPLRVLTAKGSRSDLMVQLLGAAEARDQLAEQLAEARREAAHARSAADTAGRTLQAMSEQQAPEWATAEIVNDGRVDELQAEVERLTAERDQAQAQVDRALDDADRVRAASARIIDQLRAHLHSITADVQAKQDSIDILKDQRADLRQEVTELGRQLAETAGNYGRLLTAVRSWRSATAEFRETFAALDAE